MKNILNIVSALKVRLLFVVPFFLFAFFVSAQTYRNEWIQFDQSYWKVAVNRTGIYRISYAELQNVGFPVNSADPRRLQVFFRGQELAVKVVGEQDGVFNADDYIEFYGIANDGFLDRSLYAKDSLHHIPNPYSNIWDNFTYCFITLSPSSFGKRIALYNDTQTGLPIPTHHLNDTVAQWQQYWSSGNVFAEPVPGLNNQGALDARYVNGKGWMQGGASWGQLGRVLPVNIRVNNVYRGADHTIPTMEVRAVGRYMANHTIDYRVGTTPSNLRVVATTPSFYGQTTNVLTTNLSVSDFGNDSIIVAYTINLSPAGLAAIKISYPQSFNQAGLDFKSYRIPAMSSATKATLQINNATANTRLFDISDMWQVIELNARLQSGILSANYSSANTERRIIATSQILASPEIKAVNFSYIDPTKYDYLIVTHAKLMQPISGVTTNAVRDYANYRATPQGGAYKPYIADVQQLYDQFTYGEYTPLAIRTFVKYMIDKGNPKYLFLIGKSRNVREPGYHKRRQINALGSDTVFQDFVPTWSWPHCDECITEGLTPDAVGEAIPTGRITAIKPQNVLDYLNKVKQHEALETATSSWRKNALFISGGSITNPTGAGYEYSQVIQFRMFVETLANIVSGKYFGMNPKILSRKTSDEVEFFNITKEVNEGLGLILFYGHSDASFTEIDVGYPSNPVFGYQNSGKYPLMVVNGCNAGALSNSGVTIGEDWILVPNKGASLFIAHSYLGLSGAQFNYNVGIFNTLFADSAFIYKPFGVAYKEAKKRYRNLFTNDMTVVSNAQQFVLQGDPALALYPVQRADYKITASDIYLKSYEDKGLFLADADSFAVAAVISNIGIFNTTPFKMAVKRTFADGTTKLYPLKTVQPIGFKDTIMYNLVQTFADKSKAVGTNTFEVIIDYTDTIPELNENNNRAQIINQRFIRAALRNVYPAEFSIVNKKRVGLFALNLNSQTKDREYIMQIDTTIHFNSPLFRQTFVTSDISPSWTLDLPTVRDTTVFYWRVNYAQILATDDSLWAQSSFVLIPDGPTGWSQSHFPQYQKNSLFQVMRNDAERKWDIQQSVIPIDITTSGDSATNKQYKIVVNGIDYEIDPCLDGITLVRLHKESITPLRTPFHGSASPVFRCGIGEPNAAISFPEWIQGFNVLHQYFIQPANDPPFLQNGEYVVMMSKGYVNWNGLTALNKAAATRMGLSDTIFNSLKPGEPFFAIGRFNGATVPGTLITQARAVDSATAGAVARKQTISRRTSVGARWRTGTITSTLIGPAKDWSSVYRRFSGRDFATDKWVLNIIGVDTLGNEQVLMIDSLPQDEGKLLNISAINANQYPYLRLQAVITADSVFNTHLNLDKWQVFYTSLPEGVLLNDPTAINASSQRPQRTEGDTIRFGYIFRNISEKDFSQKIVINYSVNNFQTNRRETFYDTLPALKAGEQAVFKTPIINTLGWGGDNVLVCNVNPALQPEQVYTNNVGEVKFYVKEDKFKPILDVAFDGKYIMDGEIVSPTPTITIGIRDENKFLIMSDTVGIEILISACDSCIFSRVPFSSSLLSFQTLPNNQLQVTYRPEKLADGVYSLRVQARDVKGNQGLRPYTVKFEVVNTSSVTHFYPYPNPFSTNVRFVYTLTGDQIPDEMKIQIMTVSGKVVREITQDELGPLRVGNNITDFAWDGKDEFGDQLANGVYLYRVITRSRGNSIDRRETAGDKFFEKGIGKMYLLR